MAAKVATKRNIGGTIIEGVNTVSRAISARSSRPESTGTLGSVVAVAASAYECKFAELFAEK